VIDSLSRPRCTAIRRQSVLVAAFRYRRDLNFAGRGRSHSTRPGTSLEVITVLCTPPRFNYRGYSPRLSRPDADVCGRFPPSMPQPAQAAASRVILRLGYWWRGIPGRASPAWALPPHRHKIEVWLGLLPPTSQSYHLSPIWSRGLSSLPRARIHWRPEVVDRPDRVAIAGHPEGGRPVGATTFGT
jgi:hypothetical protein